MPVSTPSSALTPLLHAMAVHRKEYLQKIALEPTHLQHRVEVSNPRAPYNFLIQAKFSYVPPTLTKSRYLR